MKDTQLSVVYQIRISQEMVERLRLVSQRLGLRQVDVVRSILAEGLAKYALERDKEQEGEKDAY